MSVKDDTIEVMVEHDLINWILKLLEKSKQTEIHIFSLDFSSALLANILHSPPTLEKLEQEPNFAKDIMMSLLQMLKENIPSTVLMHILICLSYLSKERFST